MPNYKLSKIYSIQCDDVDGVYIGSTCGSIVKRHSRHKSTYKRWLKDPTIKCCSSKSIVKYFSSTIKLICEYPCESKAELLKKEGEYIKNTKNCVNKCIAGRSTKEEMKKYRYEHFECACGGSYKYHSKAIHMKSKKHKYFAETGNIFKDVVLPKNKTFIECPCGGTHNMKKHAILSHGKSARHKYYIKHGKPKQVTNFKEIQTCECGGTYTNKNRHNESKKHKKYSSLM